MIEIYYVDEVLIDLEYIDLIKMEDKKSFVFEYVIEKHLIKGNYLTNFLSLLNPLNMQSKNKLKNKQDLNIITLGDGFQESNAFFYIQQGSKKFDNYNLIYKHIEYKTDPSVHLLIEENILVRKVIKAIRNKKDSVYYKLELNNINDMVLLYEKKLPTYLRIYNK